MKTPKTIAVNICTILIKTNAMVVNVVKRMCRRLRRQKIMKKYSNLINTKIGVFQLTQIYGTFFRNIIAQVKNRGCYRYIDLIWTIMVK